MEISEGEEEVVYEEVSDEEEEGGEEEEVIYEEVSEEEAAEEEEEDIVYEEVSEEEEAEEEKEEEEEEDPEEDEPEEEEEEAEQQQQVVSKEDEENEEAAEEEEEEEPEEEEEEEEPEEEEDEQKDEAEEEEAEAEQHQQQVSNEEEKEQNPKQTLSVAESISHAQSLHGALSNFLLHYNALQQTLDSINSSIDAIAIKYPNPKPINSSIDAIAIKHPKPKARTDVQQLSKLESICLANGAKPLRRYISTNLSEIDRLREEVPKALKLAPDPAKLAFEAMGRFYRQGGRTYANETPAAMDARRSSILSLEFYVLAGFEAVPPLVQKDARDAALAWRSRLISEGGIESAHSVDALGLTLLLASFGIPAEFTPNDLYTLLRLSNWKKKVSVLRRSMILVQKMPDIIKDMLAKKMHVEAIDLIFAFHLKKQFPPLSLLSSFVEKVREVELEKRRDGQCSLKALKESYEKELAALKSVNDCVENHKFNATKLADLKINQKIAECEEEISKVERKLQDNNLKRRFEDVEPPKTQDNQAKQFKPSAEASGSPHVQSIRQTQEMGTAISDSRYAYIANKMPLSSEASHGSVDRFGVRLLEQNVHGPAGGWQGNAFHQESSGHSSVPESARFPAAAGQNASQPPASVRNAHQPPVSGQNAYQPSPLVQNVYKPPSGNNAHQLPASGQNPDQSHASGQNPHHQPAYGQIVYQPSPSVQNVYTPHALGQNAHQPPALGHNVFQPSALGHNAHYPPASGQNYHAMLPGEQKKPAPQIEHTTQFKRTGTPANTGGHVCHYCHKPGHVKMECRLYKGLCLRCGSSEHSISGCPKMS